MIRMLIVGYCYGIRFERRLCEKVELHINPRLFLTSKILETDPTVPTDLGSDLGSLPPLVG
jgi:hypothetical protein